jgi:hypothetical protein
MQGPLPAVLCVDVEPDARQVPMPDPEPRFCGFEALLVEVEAVRSRLAAASGRPCALTWFLRMDLQVAMAYGRATFIADRYGTDLAGLAAAGDELGLHTHSYRWQNGLGWVQDQADADHVARCARTSLDAYRRAFGRPCRAYRHGDRFMSSALASVLADGGVRVDLTLEPGEPAVPGLDRTEQNRGLIPHVPRDRGAPYVADPEDVLEPGDCELVIIPLTTSVGVTEDTAPGEIVPFSTLRLWRPPREFAAMLEARLTDPELTHLAFAIRSDLPLHPREWSWFQANLEHLSGHPLAADVAWVTASRARELLLPRAGTSPGRPRWPDDAQAAVALCVLAAALGDGLAVVERELASERAWRAADVAALQAAVARGVDLEQRLARTEAERRRLEATLAAVRGTTWWRLHEHLLPVLRALVRIRRRPSIVGSALATTSGPRP